MRKWQQCIYTSGIPRHWGSQLVKINVYVQKFESNFNPALNTFHKSWISAKMWILKRQYLREIYYKMHVFPGRRVVKKNYDNYLNPFWYNAGKGLPA